MMRMGDRHRQGIGSAEQLISVLSVNGNGLDNLLTAQRNRAMNNAGCM